MALVLSGFGLLGAEHTQAQTLRGVICQNAKGKLVVRKNCRGKSLTRVTPDNISSGQGATGKPGIDGLNGADGKDGVDGKDGRDGALGFYFNGSSPGVVAVTSVWFPVNQMSATPIIGNGVDQTSLVPILGTSCSKVHMTAVIDSNAAADITVSILRALTFGVVFNAVPICTITTGSNKCEGELSLPIDELEGALVSFQSDQTISRRIKWNYRCVEL